MEAYVTGRGHSPLPLSRTAVFGKIHFTRPIFQMRKLRHTEGLSDFLKFKGLLWCWQNWGLKLKTGLSKLQALSRPQQDPRLLRTSLSKYQTRHLGGVTNHPVLLCPDLRGSRGAILSGLKVGRSPRQTQGPPTSWCPEHQALSLWPPGTPNGIQTLLPLCGAVCGYSLQPPWL